MTNVGEDLVEAFEEMAAYMRGEVQVESYHTQVPDAGHYPGWLIAIMWLVLVGLSWVPIIGAIYIAWSWWFLI
jgi:hypothetical protein